MFPNNFFLFSRKSNSERQEFFDFKEKIKYASALFYSAKNTSPPKWGQGSYIIQFHDATSQSFLTTHSPRKKLNLLVSFCSFGRVGMHIHELFNVLIFPFAYRISGIVVFFLNALNYFWEYYFSPLFKCKFLFSYIGVKMLCEKVCNPYLSF